MLLLTLILLSQRVARGVKSQAKVYRPKNNIFFLLCYMITKKLAASVGIFLGKAEFG